MQCTHCKQGVIKEQQQQIHNQKKNTHKMLQESWKLNQSHITQETNLLKGYNSKGLHVSQQISLLYRKL